MSSRVFRPKTIAALDRDCYCAPVASNRDTALFRRVAKRLLTNVHPIISRPTSNLTGVNIFADVLNPKRQELLHERFR
jgi:hypothetical protein